MAVPHIREGIQHEHSPSEVHTHQYVYVDNRKPIEVSLLNDKYEEALCDTILHEAYMSVLGAVAWEVLTRAELALYAHALQRRAQAPRIEDCNKLISVIGHMKLHRCGLKSVALRHPLELVGFISLTQHLRHSLASLRG